MIGRLFFGLFTFAAFILLILLIIATEDRFFTLHNLLWTAGLCGGLLFAGGGLRWIFTPKRKPVITIDEDGNII